MLLLRYFLTANVVDNPEIKIPDKITNPNKLRKSVPSITFSKSGISLRLRYTNPMRRHMASSPPKIPCNIPEKIKGFPINIFVAPTNCIVRIKKRYE